MSVLSPALLPSCIQVEVLKLSNTKRFGSFSVILILTCQRKGFFNDGGGPLQGQARIFHTSLGESHPAESAKFCRFNAKFFADAVFRARISIHEAIRPALYCNRVVWCHHTRPIRWLSLPRLCRAFFAAFLVMKF